MANFVQQVVIGLSSGAIFALLALALVLIHRATGVINFAQGEMAMFSTYIAWQLVQWGLPYWVAFFLTLALSFVGGYADTFKDWGLPLDLAHLRLPVAFVFILLVLFARPAGLFGRAAARRV